MQPGAPRVSFFNSGKPLGWREEGLGVMGMLEKFCGWLCAFRLRCSRLTCPNPWGDSGTSPGLRTPLLGSPDSFADRVSKSRK